VSERIYEYGNSRFTCECQQHFSEVADALSHTFAGHEVGVETYRMGKWYWDDSVTVAEMILRGWGGDAEALIREVEAIGDHLETVAQMEASRG